MIHLGYSIPHGELVEIPLKHLAVVGQTQESGKTTTLEALTDRAGADHSAIAFITKRGEGAFADGRRIGPYFRDRADWQFVDQLLEAQLHEKNKFLRPWIMKLCRDTRTLADVQRKIRAGLVDAKGITEGVYTQLDAYLELIVPEISRATLAKSIDLHPGLNVMDVSGYPTPMQMLFVQSAIEWVMTHCRSTITIVPEAWEFIPEGRGSPVKLAAIALVRKGAGLGNFIWIDSQDLAGVDKTILRGCSVWLLGVQREANEIKRTLQNIPAGIKKPTPADIAHLHRGQFFACWADRTIKTYVQPAWMDASTARRVAVGDLTAGPSRPKPSPHRPQWERAHELVDPQQARPPAACPTSEAEMHVDAVLHQVMTKLDLLLTRSNSAAAPASPPPTGAGIVPADEESLYQRFKVRLLEEAPGLVKILAQRPELQVEVERQVITADGSSCYGMLAQLIAEGFFTDTVTATAAWNELKRRGFNGISARVYEQLPKLTSQGFLTKEGKDGYRAVKGMKANIVHKK